VDYEYGNELLVPTSAANILTGEMNNYQLSNEVEILPPGILHMPVLHDIP
jgi:hypothetical protein